MHGLIKAQLILGIIATVIYIFVGLVGFAVLSNLRVF